MKVAIAVFVKTPGVSKFKTRLSKDLGEKKTREFYLMSLAATEKMLSSICVSAQPISFYWSVAEKEGLSSKLWQKHSSILQNGDHLGERLDYIYSSLKNKHDCVVLMGSDSPQLESKFIQDHLQSFVDSSKDFLMGKTNDGGFYLFAGKKEIKKNIWTQVSYSTEKTAEELEQQLELEGSIQTMPKSFDIDQYSDLNQLTDIETVKLYKEQKELIEWTQEILKK